MSCHQTYILNLFLHHPFLRPSKLHSFMPKYLLSTVSGTKCTLMGTRDMVPLRMEPVFCLRRLIAFPELFSVSQIIPVISQLWVFEYMFRSSGMFFPHSLLFPGLLSSSRSVWLSGSTVSLLWHPTPTQERPPTYGFPKTLLLLYQHLPHWVFIASSFVLPSTRKEP